MSSGSVNVNSLFKSANQVGDLSNQAMKALTIVDLGEEIQAGLGVSVDDVQASEVTLVTLMPDDSGSIRMVAGNTQAVRDGHNLVLSSLKDSKQDDSILVHTRLLNGEIIFPYCQLSQAVPLNQHNYNPDKGTPLYKQSIVLLGTVLAKFQQFADNGVPVGTVTAIITDGHDEHSGRVQAKDVAAIVKDMLKSEMHIIAGMGIQDGYTNFEDVFMEMGILKEWILTPKNTPSEIRKAFGALSKSAVRASQSKKSFSQTAIGGFGV